MKIPRSSLTIHASKRWWISSPFVLALFVVLFLGWAGVQTISFPYDGVGNIRATGFITEIETGGPAYGKLQAGDRVISVDGHPYVILSYGQKRGGDEVHFVIERGNSQLTIGITLAKPSVREILSRLAPLLVAFIFWLVGVSVQAMRPADGSSIVFFLFFQSSAVFLAAGSLSYQFIWGSALFNFILWFIGPLAVHFHLHFPQSSSSRWKPFLLIVLYVQALIGGLPYLTLGPEEIRSIPNLSEILKVQRLFLALNLLMVVFLLIYAYRHATSPGARGKIRIVVLGGVLSALPLIILTILPEAIQQQPIVPYPFAFLLLSILPLTYGYAIIRHRLIEIEKHVNRGATYILVYTILGGFYLLLYTILHQRWLPVVLGESLINTLLVMILATIFVPVHRKVQRIVDTVFYGGWYDYRSAVTEIAQGVEQITDLQSLAYKLSERLSKTLRLEDTCVFLRDVSGNFSAIEAAPHGKLNGQSTLTFTTLPVSSLTFLLKLGGDVGRSSLRKALSEVALTPEEHQLLNSEQDHLWVPVIGHGQVQGLFALGPKYGGDIFSGEDLDILRAVARQVCPVIENIHLLTQLRQYNAELERRVDERTAELHNAKERVEAILASVGDGVVVTDLNGNILTVNTAFEQQSGFSASILSGQGLYRLLSEQNEPGVLAEIQTTLSKGNTWSGELVTQRYGGSTYNIYLTIAPVRDQSGQVISYVGSQRDITHQKELDQMKDHFVADVSHELRTPTSNIHLYIELLEDAPPEKHVEYLRVLKQQSLLLRRLVEEILDLSRLTMGKAKSIEFQPVDLNFLTEQVLTAHRPVAEASGLALAFEPGVDLPVVRGEPNQLARVITNLVSNAVRYTRSGRVSVRTYHSDGQFCLEVQDTGIGIDPEDLPHLFERFYRGRQVRQSKIPGTGLGLAIIKEIVDLHEGCVTVQSSLGKGSTFRIWLPLDRKPVECIG